MGDLLYSSYREGLELEISELVWEVFKEFEGEGYSEEGIKTFKEFISPNKIANEVKENAFKIYCCFDMEKLVGVLALRDINHIALLFVRKSHHKRGIGKTLLNSAIKNIAKEKSATKEITVNSSRYAIEIYKKLGFHPTDTIQTKNGIVFMPMVKALTK